MTKATTESCEDLANQLSENYRNLDPFQDMDDTNNSNKKGRIANYLNGHGLLLTMCFPFSCTINPQQDDHISASWIRQDLGLQVIPAESSVGLLLDPTASQINCIYPTDGGTSERDDQGCGPARMDPQAGSSGAAKANFVMRRLIRRAMQQYKSLNFGQATPWEEIDCRYMFPTPLDLAEALIWKNQTTSSTEDVLYQNIHQVMERQFGAIMGHTVCHNNRTAFTEDDHNEIGTFYWYRGIHSWDPMDWNYMVEMQLDFLMKPQRPSIVWNEIVLDLPKEMQDLVLGVFYLEQEDEDHDDNTLSRRRSMAHGQAKLLGNKPVFQVSAKNDKRGKNILECDNGDGYKESTSATTTTTTTTTADRMDYSTNLSRQHWHTTMRRNNLFLPGQMRTWDLLLAKLAGTN